ncbi:MAG: hypothetical protein M1813_001326 [Trichoglossum hirsutum]|nr:MAG: hypothetical protein M1813_001326 [Trichoglossum hirsutum]
MLLCTILCDAVALNAREPPRDSDICIPPRRDCFDKPPPPPPPPPAQPGTIWITHYALPPQCSGDTCSHTSNDGYPHIEIHGSGFSGGQVNVGIFPVAQGSPIWFGSANGGNFAVQTGVVDCTDEGNPAFVRVLDVHTGLWSNIVGVKTGCPLW